MFSKSCEYGIRALTIIGQYNETGKKIGIKEICRLANTPESFTAKILQQLVKRKILSSQKGPTGGFYFKREIENISLFEIINAIDGENIFSKCGLGLDKCDAKNPCPMHDQYEEVRTSLVKMCKNSSLQQLTKDTKVKHYQR